MRSADLLLAQRPPHQQRVFIGLAQHQAVERVLVGAQRVDGGSAVVHDAVQQAEFGGGTAQLAHADVNADVRQAALLPAAAEFGFQLFGAGLRVTERRRHKESSEGQKNKQTGEHKPKLSHYHLSSREDKTTDTEDSAMAAEPIHGCSTRPMGRNTPGGKTVLSLSTNRLENYLNDMRHDRKINKAGFLFYFQIENYATFMLKFQTFPEKFEKDFFSQGNGS